MDTNGRRMLLKNLVTNALPITAPVIYFFVGGRLCRLQHNPLAGIPLALCFASEFYWPFYFFCGLLVEARSFSGLSLLRLLLLITSV